MTKRWWQKPNTEYTKKEHIYTHVSGYCSKVWTVKELKDKLKRLDQNDKDIKESYRYKKGHNRLERLSITKALKIREGKKK